MLDMNEWGVSQRRIQMAVCLSILEWMEFNPRADFEWFCRNFGAGVRMTTGQTIGGHRFAAMCRSLLVNGHEDTVPT